MNKLLCTFSAPMCHTLGSLVCLAGLACSSSAGPDYSGGPQASTDRVGILITDWGTPEGFDYRYSESVEQRSLIGYGPEDARCTDTFVGLEGQKNSIGLLPPGLVANKGHLGAFWAGLYDSYGVYRHDVEGARYESIIRDEQGAPAHVITETELAAHALERLPMTESPKADAPLTGRAVFFADPRDGSDLLAGYFHISLGADNGLTKQGNGISDARELALAGAIRATRASSRNTVPMENTTVQLVEQRTAEHLETLFGDRVDVRTGKYAAFMDRTRNHEDVAMDFVDEGFWRLLLTRETTDNNNYANQFMTRNHVERAFCHRQVQTGRKVEMDIAQVRQVGRTPEYNTAMLEVIRPHLDALADGTEVAILYTTYGLPWPGAEATKEDKEFHRLIRPPHPSAKEVYHENAFLNYLSFKQVLVAAVGEQYQLVFTESGQDSDSRIDNLFAYGMFGPQRMSIGALGYGFQYGDELSDPLRYRTVRDQIDRAKAAGRREIIVALSHWYYSSYLTTVNLRDVNRIPYTSWEDLDKGIYTVEWCENAAEDQLVIRGGSCPATHPVHLQLTETFDNRGLPEAFALGYAHRIRGGVERFGVLPDLDIQVEARGEITKTEGGRVEVERGPLAGAALTVPADPQPARPESNTPLEVQEGKVAAFNEVGHLHEAAWDDFEAYVGTQAKGIASAPSTAGTPASPVVLIGPYRTLFNKPARVSLPYDNAVADPQLLRPSIYNEMTGGWDPVYPVAGGEVRVVDTVKRTVTFDVQTLGLFALVVP